ncbi:VOC family protein [Enterobacillus tribolii]|uniref:Phenazine antibiotic resistance protein n=1 Tax=Enterobacillus tribolii TaxID=1487935 RepID=A0A370QNY7_9GAMM|nr:VOC family protein [Enterobacillus tribolii]MBW7981897.1 drug:proton antiporter [Enterobacillus tribolii]RDK90084.1 catechol 2,3-dioxygenase-like lactoylglutathione lyase family enzyme [Enterobacillus tribolii]
MMNPDFCILYVDNPATSAEFYAGLFGVAPVESAPTFAMFVLASGAKLGLWLKQDVEPPATAPAGGCELAFSLAGAKDVDATLADWRARGLTILQEPTHMDFGYTFTAADPDGHRLRVYAGCNM